ncbi:MAG: ABC transporter permease [bacterium]
MELFDTLRQDLRLVVRTFIRQKAWTAVAVLTLALGVGANSTLFTVINAVLLKPLPFANPDRIVSISESDKGVDQLTVGSTTFADWQRSQRSFESLAASSGASTIIRGRDAAEDVSGARVTGNYFSVFGVAPARGRTFTADEDRKGGPSVIVLSDQLWHSLFGADPGVLGKTVSLDGKPSTLIGIMPASFTNERRAQYWIPLAITHTPGITFFYSVIGRLRAGGSMAVARSELTRIQRAADAPAGVDQRAMTPVLMTLHERRYGDTRTPLLVLLAAVGVLLLIACTNVANLLLARSARRQKEFAVRVALGAGRARLVRYLLTESIVLSLLGGALGFLIPVAATGYIVRIGPKALSLADQIAVDWRVAAFTFAICLATGVLFGLVPAINAGRADVSIALASGSSRATSSRAQRRYRDILVIVELATALVLLTGAGILTNSFLRILSIDSGIRPEHVLIAEPSLSRTKYPGVSATRYLDPFIARVRSLPGVRSVALADAAPLGGIRMSLVDNNAPGHVKAPSVDVVVADTAYFSTLGITLRSGRLFSHDDRGSSPPVGVVNEAFVRVLFPTANPIGQETRGGAAGKTIRIVGIVHDVLQRGIEASASPTIYTPLAQNEVDGSMTVLVNTAGDPNELAAPIRQIARDIDPAQPLPTLTTMERAMADAVAPRRFSFLLLGVFASTAALLAAIGLYGVMAYLVTERSTEIGVRVALGADRARVLGMVLGEGMRLTSVGIGIGFGASLFAARLLRQLVYQVSVYSPWTFSLAASLLAAIAFVACSVPAWRATCVDPMVALRGE